MEHIDLDHVRSSLLSFLERRLNKTPIEKYCLRCDGKLRIFNNEEYEDFYDEEKGVCLHPITIGDEDVRTAVCEKCCLLYIICARCTVSEDDPFCQLLNHHGMTVSGDHYTRMPSGYWETHRYTRKRYNIDDLEIFYFDLESPFGKRWSFTGDCGGEYLTWWCKECGVQYELSDK